MTNEPHGTYPDDAELVSQAITATGRTLESFARHLLTRDPRTVRRWLNGQRELPAEVRERCEQIVAAALTIGPIRPHPKKQMPEP